MTAMTSGSINWKVFICLILFQFGWIKTSSAQVLVDINFNSTNDLTTFFNSDGAPVNSNIPSTGISNSGTVQVPPGFLQDVWTLKQGYTFCKGVGDRYIIEAYFKTQFNSGRGGLGFATSTPNASTGIGYTPVGLGMTFHGGGAEFISNGNITYYSWFATSGDLVQGNWYRAQFIVDVVGLNTYDLTLNVHESSSSGVVGSLHASISQVNVVNSNLYSSALTFPYFSNNGYRMTAMDNFHAEIICNSLLPVELSSFESQCIDNSIVLNWATTTEMNNDYFEIQYSENGNDFIPLGTIDGKGNSTTSQHYKYTIDDYRYYKGYFRLKQVDTDGEYTYSKILFEHCNSEKIFVYMSGDEIVISSNENVQEIFVVDMMGKILYTGSDKQISTLNFSQGTYIINVLTDSRVNSFRVIK